MKIISEIQSPAYNSRKDLQPGDAEYQKRRRGTEKATHRLNMQSIPISKIQRARYNPRKTLKPGDPSYDRLRKGMETFGLVEPLVWNQRSGNLVGGHQRLSVLEQRGEDEVEVSVVDLAPREEKALNLSAE